MEEDVFTFKISPKDKPVTRRGILSVTSALYDPLGLVSPVTVVPKVILQDLCRAVSGQWASLKRHIKVPTDWYDLPRLEVGKVTKFVP